ncbi:thioesterase family protein [Echinicola sp. CAU 1574]|uniref:Thioesterase family protein n=1 Tax=Echinicola arenosa TaxID=2774144 RepID=A0ABR9ASX1_9BACT|nr:thioesterase family protein [Echinicola arenosa]MBD8490983.1 thioesterase family protein [Echinicola arenosa]
MESNTFEYPMIIKEFHLDTFGHVNNATYLEIYEEARWQFITDNGYGLKEIKKTGLGPVILEIKIRFIKELKLREEITIFSKTKSYKSKVGTIEQWILDSQGNRCSEVEMTIGLFDTKARKLVLPTPEWLKAIS